MVFKLIEQKNVASWVPTGYFFDLTKWPSLLSQGDAIWNSFDISSKQTFCPIFKLTEQEIQNVACRVS